jgi:RNA polymerase sigma-70 factor (ECF subfamily)
MAERKEDFLTYQFKAGSVDAFKSIFNQYYKPLCSFARKYVFDLAVAEDIIQELFVKFWEQRNEIQLKTSAKSYLFQSARNECLNYLKHQHVKEKYKTHVSIVSTDSFFHDSLEEEEINQLVYRTIQSLPSRRKQIFEMSRFEGKSIEEIARELSISRNTIKNQLVKALKQIRQVLEKNERFG